MTIPDDDTTRMLEEECPGSPDLESALLNETVGNAASHPALLADASTPVSRVLQLMRDGNRGAALVISNGTPGWHLHGARCANEGRRSAN